MLKYLILLKLLEKIAVCFDQNSRGVIWPSGCADDYPSVASFCYVLKEETTYPYECTYKDTSPFVEYNSKLLKHLAALGIKFWVPLRQDPRTGYYEWLEIGDDYGKLFDEATYEGGECIIIDGKENTYTTRSCDSKNMGLCVYPVQRNVKNYCDAYNEICDTSKYCHCETGRHGFYCESACSDTSYSECAVCAKKFEEYPTPTITLKLQNDYVLVTVTSVLKLYYITSSNVVYCYTDLFEPSSTLLRYRYDDNDVSVSKTSGDTITYQFKQRDLGLPGHYWCEGFLYPDLEIIRSNAIIVGNDYGLNFVLNVTIQLTSSHQFLPYNIHTLTQETIRERVDSSKILNVRSIEILKLYDDQQKLDMVLHISTQPSIDDVEKIFEELKEDLDSLRDDKEIISYSLSNSQVCMSEITDIDGSIITWPTTAIGSVATPKEIILQPDGSPLTRACEGSFKYGSYWADIEGTIDLDHEISDTTTCLKELLASNQTPNEKNKNLNTILLDAEEFIPFDIHLIAEIFKQIATPKKEYDFDTLMDNLNIVTEIDRNVLSESQLTLNATDSLLYTFDVALGTVPSQSLVTDNVVTQVADLRSENVVGLAIYKVNGKITTVALDRSASLDNIERKNLVLATYIPSELLNQILETSDSQINLVTAIYLNDALFNSNDTKTSASVIISMFVVNFHSTSLETSIPIIFEPTIGSRHKKHCGYWNYGINDLWTSFLGHWNVDDEAKFDADTKMCRFAHMTHFALLVGGEENEVINYLSTIGGGLSLISVFLIFATAIISKSWRESAGTKILLNFSAAVALQMILLIILSLVDSGENETICTALGMLLHYTVISQFCWALIISYLQYRKFVQVLVNEPSSIVSKSCIFAWGAAAIPVLISFFLDKSNYNFHDICYPSGNYLYFGLYLPITLIISINIFMFTLIFRSVLYKRSNAFGQETNVIMLRVKLGIILFFLMGFSWIFGLFGTFLDSNILLYVFCLTNAIQGLVLYMYFIVCNKGTRRLWVKQFKKVTNHRSAKDENKTSTTSQPDSQNKKY